MKKNSVMSESLRVNDLFSVKGKYVLVTGGGRGIGLMIAAGFASNGATVFISSRDGPACEKTAAELSKETGGQVIALPPVDLATLDGVKNLAASVKDALMATRKEFALDVLVNNSGVSWGEGFETFSEKGWDKVIDTNVKAVFFLTQALAPALEAGAKKGTHASVINVGSIAGLSNQPLPTFSYDTSKAAVHHLGRHLASTLASRKITVNNIAPGLVPSKMSKQLQVYTTEDKLTQAIPLKRQGRPSDMAGLCIYFAAPSGAWTTGTTVAVDGGALVSGDQKM